MALRLRAADIGFPEAFSALLAAKRESAADVEQTVGAIIEDVRRRGDAALIDYTRRFDRHEAKADALRVSAGEIAAAVAGAPAAVLGALRLAHDRIESHHRRQR